MPTSTPQPRALSTSHQLPDYQITQSPIPPFPASLLRHLPPGHLTLLIGDPGSGKSFLALEIAAHLSRNANPPPPSPNPNLNLNQNPPSFPPSSELQPFELLPSTTSSPLPIWLKPPSPKHPILLLAFEDNECTIRARLHHSGANPDHIRLLDPDLSLLPPSPESDEQYPSLITAIAGLLNKKIVPSLLIIDPLSAALGTQDTYFPATVNRLLEPLLRLAQNFSIPLLAIGHLAKPSSLNKHPLNRIRGSQAYRALARSILYTTDNDLSLPSPHLNQNLPSPCPRVSASPCPPHFPSLLIPLKNTQFPLTEAFPFAITHPGRIRWSPTSLNSHPLLKHGQAPATPEPAPELLLQKSQLDEALRFLETTLVFRQS